ncbi:MAG: cation transporter, partial [Eubacteriales bacterium]
MEQYRVTGMSCAACSARVEKAVSAVPGVTACSVSLLTNSMGVEGSASPGEIIRAVEEAGYGASLKRTEGNQADSAAAGDEEALQDRETPILKKRLIASVILLIPLLYLSMGHMMWGWPLPKWFDGNHVAMGLVQLVLTGLIMVINQRFFISGFRALLHRAPNMDTLVALGASAAFLWSLCVLFVMTRAVVDGDEETVMR